MSLPPAATNAAITPASGARSSGFEPTSKTFDVPSPITGRGSPDLGIGRVIIVVGSVEKISGAPSVAPAPAAARVRRASRRCIEKPRATTATS
jgi:hypothetical protein